MASVLVVDDDAEARDVVARYLQKSGHAVRKVPNGNKALEALTEQTPDVVVLDYRMPELDGISFLEVIRCYLRWQSLPVVLLTAYGDGDHIRRAMELGVTKTFIKGDYDLGELRAHVESCGGHPPPRSTPPKHWSRDPLN